jgi:hypothetical protein
LALKIPLLLVQYLYLNRKMSLPGLGIFTLDKSVVLPEENDRALLSMPNAVQFQNANIPSADKELISFICEHTGKIRPLAISDLDSYLNLGTEMLNIGKPFHLEGIGTITKNKSGKFDFSPGEYTLIKEHSDTHESGKKKTPVRDKKLPITPTTVSSRNFLKILAVAAALAIVGWGGWLVYKKNNTTSGQKSVDTSSVVSGQQTSAMDTVALAKANRDVSKPSPTDSAHPSASQGQSSANYKFIILTTTNKPHALRRYNQLMSFDLKVHLYQKDSSLFKVYFQFPALASDTLHIKDSLRREYAHNVTIEP